MAVAASWPAERKAVASKSYQALNVWQRCYIARVDLEPREAVTARVGPVEREAVALFKGRRFGCLTKV